MNEFFYYISSVFCKNVLLKSSYDILYRFNKFFVVPFIGILYGVIFVSTLNTLSGVVVQPYWGNRANAEIIRFKRK